MSSPKCGNTMTEPERNDDEEPQEEATLGDNPFMHIDYRVFEISVHGGPDDDLEDVNEIAEERLEDALEQIEELKRTDFQLDDEFDVERNGGGGRGMMA